jgi:hypothetical protein
MNRTALRRWLSNEERSEGTEEELREIAGKKSISDHPLTLQLRA